MGALLSFLETGLQKTDSGLGDRSKYVGASDIGHCLEKAYLSKTLGETHLLKQQIIFQRGHIGEEIIRNGLLNTTETINFREQVEAKGIEEINSFIASHIDFVIDFPNEHVVVECKTISSALPDNQPRQSWIYQVQLQIGLLRATTDKKCDRGKIIAMNLNTGEAHEFDVVFNELLYNVAIQRANILWEAVQTKTAPKGEVSDLCGFCSFRTQCQTLKRGAVELPEEVEAIAQRVKEHAAIEKSIKADKQNLKAFLEATGAKRLSLIHI